MTQTAHICLQNSEYILVFHASEAPETFGKFTTDIWINCFILFMKAGSHAAQPAFPRTSTVIWIILGSLASLSTAADSLPQYKIILKALFSRLVYFFFFFVLSNNPGARTSQLNFIVIIKRTNIIFNIQFLLKCNDCTLTIKLSVLLLYCNSSQSQLWLAGIS